MYPICIEFKAADGTIAKSAITFLSEDKEHSHQQIQQFEHRLFEIVREKLHRPLNHWIRYSDGCGAQFKSGYVVADMLRATENYQVKSVSFNYFEFHEGKSCSDSIGSIVRCSFTRSMLKSQQAVCNIDDTLAAGLEELKIWVHDISCTPIQVCIHVAHGVNFFASELPVRAHMYADCVCHRVCDYVLYENNFLVLYYLTFSTSSDERNL